MCFVESPDRGKTKPAHCFGRFIAIPVLTRVTSLDFNVTSSDALISYPISDECFCEGTFPFELISFISISIFLFNGNLSLMNIRDYLFIRKAKSSNKIKILDVLGFETDTTIIQTPDIIKEMDNIRMTSELEMVDVEIESAQIGQELVTTNENLFDTSDQDNLNPNTETFVPLNITSQIKKIWTDLEIRRKWVFPAFLTITTVGIISFASVFFINMRNTNLQNETIAVSISKETNENINQISELLSLSLIHI